jgi:hypothetical protein
VSRASGRVAAVPRAIPLARQGGVRRWVVVCSARRSARVVRGLLRAFLYLSIYLSLAAHRPVFIALRQRRGRTPPTPMETAADNQIYPPMDKKPIPSSTSFIAELRSSQNLPDPRPSSAEPKAKHCIRGDSYLGGLDQMDKLVSKLSDEELEKQLQMRLMLAAAHSYSPPPHTFGPVVVVSSYTQFNNLAHGPRGTEATRSMRSYRLNISDGSLTLLSVTGEGAIHNPAFSHAQHVEGVALIVPQPTTLLAALHTQHQLSRRAQPNGGCGAAVSPGQSRRFCGVQPVGAATPSSTLSTRAPRASRRRAKWSRSRSTASLARCASTARPWAQVAPRHAS